MTHPPANHLHKRVTPDMLSEYLAMGWKVHAYEGRFVMLVWTKPGAPK
jgi:hypothetical protein